MSRTFAALACALQLFAASLAGDSRADAEAALDRRVMAFSREMRCLVCQNETLADSQADLAVDLRREIRAQMVAGRSDEEITAFLADRYGDFVRYRPALKPSTYLLWFGPFVLLAGGLVTLARALTISPSRRGPGPMPAAARKRARQLLERNRGSR